MEANIALDNTRLGDLIQSRFKPSNAEQEDAMANRSTVEEPMMTGLAMAIPGPKGLEGAMAAEGAKATGAGLSKAEGIANQISESGFHVTQNPKTSTQESNITITHPSEPGTKLNLRTETHPLNPAAIQFGT